MPGEHGADISRGGACATWAESSQTSGKRPRGKVEDRGNPPPPPPPPPPQKC